MMLLCTKGFLTKDIYKSSQNSLYLSILADKLFINTKNVIVNFFSWNSKKPWISIQNQMSFYITTLKCFFYQHLVIYGNRNLLPITEKMNATLFAFKNWIIVAKGFNIHWIYTQILRQLLCNLLLFYAWL